MAQSCWIYCSTWWSISGEKYWYLLEGIEKAAHAIPHFAEFEFDEFSELGVHVIKKQAIVDLSPLDIAFEAV